MMTLYNPSRDRKLELLSPCPKGIAFSEENVYENVQATLDVSVIIPCYNSEDYLSQCLESVLKQNTSYKFEVIAINDGSTDRTEDILENYKKIYDNLRVISQPNKGFSGARNTGIRASKGKYLIFVDSDDYIVGKYIHKLINKAYENDLDIVACGYYSFRKEKIYKKVNPKNEYDKKLLNGCFWGKAFKRELFEHFILPEGYWYEDSILQYLIYPMVKKHCTVSDIYYAYRSNPKGITISSKGKKKSLDSFYITDLMIRSMEMLPEKEFIYSQEFYEQILKQFYLNECRIAKLEKEYKKIVFYAQAEFLNKNYANYKSAIWDKRYYEKALRKMNYCKAMNAIKFEKIYKVIQMVKG